MTVTFGNICAEQTFRNIHSGHATPVRNDLLFYTFLLVLFLIVLRHFGMLLDLRFPSIRTCLLALMAALCWPLAAHAARAAAGTSAACAPHAAGHSPLRQYIAAALAAAGGTSTDLPLLAALPGASWLAHFDLTGVLCLTHFAGAFWRALTSAPHSAALPGTLCPSPLPGGCVIAPQCLKTAAK